MVNKNDKPQNAWEYADCLYLSGRLTTEEHINLKRFLLKLEAESAIIYSEGC